MGKSKKKEKYVPLTGLTGIGEDYNIYIMDPREKIIGYLIGFVAGFLAAQIMFGVVIASIVIGAAVGFYAIPVYRRYLQERRRKAILLQFRDMLDSLSNSFSAGKNTPDAFTDAYSDLKLAYGEQAPIVKEMAIIVSGLHNNFVIEDLLRDMSARCGIDDINSFAETFAVCNRLGGNLKKVVVDSRDIISDKIEIEIFSSFSGDEMEFNNIVDLKADRFTLQGVESSAIGNPKVLERQIVDYMKYRGPINIGKGLLTKLGCIGETSKQTKAIEAKVNYDQKLDTVQDACKEAYKAINEYNDLIGGNSKFASNEYLNQLSQDIDSAKKDVADMVKYLVAYNSSELNVPPLINERPSSLDSLRVIILKDQWAIFKVDSATRKEVESYYEKSKAANRELDTMAYIEGKLAERGIKVVPVENGDYGIDFGINYDEKMSLRRPQ